MFEFSWMGIQHVLMPTQGALVAFDHAPYNHQALVCVLSKRALHIPVGEQASLQLIMFRDVGIVTGVFFAIYILWMEYQLLAC